MKFRDDVSSLVLCKGQNLLINIVAAELIIHSVSFSVCVENSYYKWYQFT